MKDNQGALIPVGTSTLLRRVFKATNLRSFMDENRQSLNMPVLSDYLETLCCERGMVREHVIKSAGIERCFGHQLFRGVRKPSRDNILRLAFGLGLNVDETQALLRVARKTPLYPRIMRDAVIINGLAHVGTVLKVQTMLSDLGMTLLGDEKYEHAKL